MHSGRFCDRRVNRDPQLQAYQTTRTIRPARSARKSGKLTAADVSLNTSAIRPLPALGADPNPLTDITGIRLALQFHLPPVFRPLPRDLT